RRGEEPDPRAVVGNVHGLVVPERVDPIEVLARVLAGSGERPRALEESGRLEVLDAVLATLGLGRPVERREPAAAPLLPPESARESDLELGRGHEGVVEPGLRLERLLDVDEPGAEGRLVAAERRAPEEDARRRVLGDYLQGALEALARLLAGV